MAYKTLNQAIQELEQKGDLLRIKEEVDPNLEMASIHRKVFAEQGPAVYFEKVKGTKYPAVSNLFGRLDRSKFLLRSHWEAVEGMVALKSDPTQALKNPWRFRKSILGAKNMIPKKVSFHGLGFEEIKISDLPQMKSWPMDGGPFITLPQVYSEDPEFGGIKHSNLGMYRVQLAGNDYLQDEEIGLHYQIHRGIGVHQTKARKMNQPLKVSIFVGGPPAHTLAAVMPLPEGFSEIMFAGALAGRRFRYAYDSGGFCLSAEADFVITGTISHDELKPEGPFGDHLGYYSLQHDFPVLKVEKVYAKRDAVWPFTVVGRPPAEDSQFGALIHDLTGDAIQDNLPGVKAVHAVDEAGVHPLLFAVGSERYTPFETRIYPKEILTQSNLILGFGQLSLAKYLFIADGVYSDVNIHDPQDFLSHVLERLDPSRDLHFQTKTTIDTLDYSGEGVNQGSKLVVAAAGEPIRTLAKKFKGDLRLFKNAVVPMPGVLCLEMEKFTDATKEDIRVQTALNDLDPDDFQGFPLLVLVDDASFTGENMANFLWVCFTRSNPSHDVYGYESRFVNKHWSTHEMVLIDARIKPHHAPAMD